MVIKPRIILWKPLLSGAVVFGIASAGFWAQAQQTNGIIISGEGENVNITLDPSVIPDVSIKRNNGRTVIHIPKSSKSAASGLVIDSALKKNNTVQETDSSGGRTITVNSDQVYLITENLSSQAVSGPPIPKASGGSKPSVSDKVARTKNPPASVKPPEKPMFSVKPAQIGAQGTASTSQVVGIAAKAATSATQAPGTVAKAVASPAAAMAKSPAVTAIAIAAPASQSSPARPAPASTSSRSAEPTVDNAASQPAAESPQFSSPDAPVSSPAETPSASVSAPTAPLQVTDPEAAPLDLSGGHEAATQTSNGLMLRITLSLLTVLGLIFAFIKFVLPGLMARYPEFFENLQARTRQNLVTDKVEPGTKAQPVPKKPFGDGGLLSALMAPSGKKHYLERIAPKGEAFNILTTTKLGGGKELHLVEIQGRHLVIASTPYSVSLIKDLSDVSASESPLSDESWEEEAAEALLPSESRAYLEDELPETTPKRFSSVDKTYLKYLESRKPEPESSESERIRGQQRHIQSDIDRFMPTDASSPSYIDAEEVVVLEDYDDTY